MNLLQRALSGIRRDEKRYSFSDWVADKQLGLNASPFYGWSYSANVEEVENSFVGYINGVYKANGVIFSSIEARKLLFTEARFQFQRLQNGTPGELFGTHELDILENPWPNGTTGDLLARMEQDVSLAGNFYAVREGKRLRRLRPDWVYIVLTSAPDEAVKSDIAGYQYRPGGLNSNAEAKTYLPNEVVHWAPIPDPDAQYRGMSWITPVIREVISDKAATLHKSKFYENAATPNMVVSFKETVTEDQFEQYMEELAAAHQGATNAYKTMYLAGGADVRVVGSDFAQMDFKAVQGAGETRIAAAARVPAIIVGLSEGLAAATYSNYGQARRAFGDHWARPQWRSACAALSTVINVPRGCRLWYDDRDIAFLRDDQMDIAKIAAMNAQSIRSLVEAGYEPDAVAQAIVSDDLSILIGNHTGVFSVQLQPAVDPDADPTDVDPEPPDPDLMPDDGDDPVSAKEGN
ncbi:phage portal protein [Nonomuraea wenchangensis]|uniref:Phage portal protein n=1 Tax=Nonomuraea wenchangensis TaxID=568860 RepID=A0A1I0ED94_9ACTN|nr:phage portal protein [Nonomuraea wenchangensis]SET43225.1 Phage portal protein [Nonomuraea wenchangensis]